MNLVNIVIRKKISVLMVTDEPGDADYLRSMLKDVPGSVCDLVCAERLAAFDLINDNRPDVVLLDLSLPDSHIIETLVRFRERVHDVPVVVLMGHNDEEMAMQALRSGAQDYLVKGLIDTNVLSRTVRYAISRKQVEDELFRSQEQLRQTQKMDALGRLAGGIAHDFNNMLTSILGLANYTVARLGESHPCYHDVSEIVRTGHRAADLARRLLALTHQRTAMRIRALDLNEVIREMDQILRRSLGEDIEVVTVFGERLGRIKADEGHMEQVIMNLAINAREAMPRGGTLTIQTRNETLDDDACRSRKSLRPGDYVVLSVADTGCGMRPDVKEKAFDPLFTTKSRDKGSGLGLSTVHRIVTFFGGCIELDTEPDRGLRAIIYLPKFEEADIQKHEIEGVSAPIGSETVLVVEDEDTIRRLVVRMLEDVGYRVVHARHGGAALELCARYKGPIHLVISDVVMPHVDGPELLKRLRETRKEFKALFISGYTDGRVAESDPNQVGTPILAKPFSKGELARKVREVLDGGGRET
ncbi:MAG: response regulator [bacterium]